MDWSISVTLPPSPSARVRSVAGFAPVMLRPEKPPGTAAGCPGAAGKRARQSITQNEGQKTAVLHRTRTKTLICLLSGLWLSSKKDRSPKGYAPSFRSGKHLAQLGKRVSSNVFRTAIATSPFGYRVQIGRLVKQTLNFDSPDTSRLHVSLLGRTWQNRRNSD
jgi:hypothetical protein